MFLRVSSTRNSLYSSSLRHPRPIIKAHLTLDTQTATGVFFFSHLCVLLLINLKSAPLQSLVLKWIQKNSNSCLYIGV